MAQPLSIILFEPEIPQNTGNIGRLCAFTGARLHLIEPLGFSLDDRYLRRSGMDYWQHLDVTTHASWEAFKASDAFPKRIWLFTTHAAQSYWSVRFQPGDALLFGNEGHGCPDWLHKEIGEDHRITLPRFNDQPLRSLNLSTSVGIAAYEALRQFSLE
ncbi:MAG: tRNA (cytidine(34)-2'-O)-methyltransferase [Puniceicoccaceae bacterium]